MASFDVQIVAEQLSALVMQMQSQGKVFGQQLFRVTGSRPGENVAEKDLESNYPFLRLLLEASPSKVPPLSALQDMINLVELNTAVWMPWLS